jgi:hypothetical protein
LSRYVWIRGEQFDAIKSALDHAEKSFTQVSTDNASRREQYRQRQQRIKEREEAGEEVSYNDKHERYPNMKSPPVSEEAIYWLKRLVDQFEDARPTPQWVEDVRRDD